MNEKGASGWVLRTLVVAVPSSVLSCIVTLWVVGPSSSTPVPPRSELASEQILGRLDEIEQRMHGPLRSVEQAQEVSETERQKIVDPMFDMDRVHGQLDRVERLLAQFQHGAGLAPPPIPKDMPVNWQELSALAELHTTDRKAAAVSTSMLTPFEVVSRFGSPNESGSASNGGIYWRYDLPGAVSKRNDYIMFVFRDGYVAHHEIYLSDR